LTKRTKDESEKEDGNVQYCTGVTADGLNCQRWKQRPSDGNVTMWFCSKAHRKQWTEGQNPLRGEPSIHTSCLLAVGFCDEDLVSFSDTSRGFSRAASPTPISSTGPTTATTTSLLRLSLFIPAKPHVSGPKSQAKMRHMRNCKLLHYSKCMELRPLREQLMARIMLFYYIEQDLGHHGVQRHFKRHRGMQNVAALRNQTRGLATSSRATQYGACTRPYFRSGLDGELTTATNTLHVFLRRLARLRITAQNVLALGERVLPENAHYMAMAAHDGDCLDSQRHLICTSISEARGSRLWLATIS
jgi:hypothetical protein